MPSKYSPWLNFGNKKNPMGQDLGNTCVCVCGWGGGGGGAKQLLFLQKRRNYCGSMSGALSCRRRICLKQVAGRRFS